jgi:hypothetical protein
VTYDPASGLYLQTFPEEHAEFLRKFGYIPELSDSDKEGWSYNDGQTHTAHSEQPSGFDYNPAGYSPDVSPVSDDDGASMSQYIASPIPVPTQVNHQPINHTIARATVYHGAAPTANVNMIKFC